MFRPLVMLMALLCSGALACGGKAAFQNQTTRSQDMIPACDAATQTYIRSALAKTQGAFAWMEVYNVANDTEYRKNPDVAFNFSRIYVYGAANRARYTMIRNEAVSKWHYRVLYQSEVTGRLMEIHFFWAAAGMQAVVYGQ